MTDKELTPIERAAKEAFERCARIGKYREAKVMIDPVAEVAAIIKRELEKAVPPPIEPLSKEGREMLTEHEAIEWDGYRDGWNAHHKAMGLE